MPRCPDATGPVPPTLRRARAPAPARARPDAAAARPGASAAPRTWSARSRPTCAGPRAGSPSGWRRTCRSCAARADAFLQGRAAGAGAGMRRAGRRRARAPPPLVGRATGVGRLGRRAGRRARRAGRPGSSSKARPASARATWRRPRSRTPRRAASSPARSACYEIDRAIPLQPMIDCHRPPARRDRPVGPRRRLRRAAQADLAELSPQVRELQPALRRRRRRARAAARPHLQRLRAARERRPAARADADGRRRPSLGRRDDARPAAPPGAPDAASFRCAGLHVPQRGAGRPRRADRCAAQRGAELGARAHRARRAGRKTTSAPARGAGRERAVDAGRAHLSRTAKATRSTWRRCCSSCMSLALTASDGAAASASRLPPALRDSIRERLAGCRRRPRAVLDMVGRARPQLRLPDPGARADMAGVALADAVDLLVQRRLLREVDGGAVSTSTTTGSARWCSTTSAPRAASCCHRRAAEALIDGRWRQRRDHRRALRSGAAMGRRDAPARARGRVRARPVRAARGGAGARTRARARRRRIRR